MIRFLRTTASILVALGFAIIGLAWSQVPHARHPDPVHEIAATYDIVVGFVDLRLRGDIRGYERLVDVDPRLNGVGGGAARHVAGSNEFSPAERIRAARQLVIRHQDNGVDRELARTLAFDLPPQSLDDLQGLDSTLDIAIENRIRCDAINGFIADEMSDTCGG